MAYLRKIYLVLFLMLVFGVLAACAPSSLLEDGSASSEADNKQLAGIYATVGDTGLPAPLAGSKEAAVQAVEADAIRIAYQSLERSGFKRVEDWELGARVVSRTLSFVPMTHSELIDQANARINGEAYAEPAPLNSGEVLSRQRRASTEYSEQLLRDLPGLSSEQLVNLRVKLTVALAILKTQREHNTGPQKIADSILELIETTNQSLRGSIIAEMRRRGIIE